MNKASDIMSTKIKKIDHTASIFEALDMMRRNFISCVFVTENKKPIGIVTERDIVHKAIPENLNLKRKKITSIMSAPLVMGEVEYDIAQISTIMHDHKIRRVPIMHENKLVGIVTQTDIVNEAKVIADHTKKIKTHQKVQTILIVVCVILSAVIAYLILNW